jgi:nitrite reductase/ring-hydroxylating ferredoxin subunit
MVEADEEVPEGTSRKLVIKGNDYLLIHTSKGFSVSDFLCPHQHEPLDGGKTNNFDEIICPLHEYRFSLKTGIESSNRCKSLRLYQIAEKSDGLYIEI